MSINLCSKPVCNMKAEWLRQVLFPSLEKGSECDFKIRAIILDGATTNTKLVRSILTTINADQTKVPLPELKLNTNFIHKGNKHFVLFCLVHILKCVRNALFRNNNYFHFPKLVLSAGHTLESGVCAAKHTRQLCHSNKEKAFDTSARCIDGTRGSS